MIYPRLKERQSVKHETQSSKLLIVQFTFTVNNIWFFHQVQHIVSAEGIVLGEKVLQDQFWLEALVGSDRILRLQIVLKSVTKLTKINSFTNMSWLKHRKLLAFYKKTRKQTFRTFPTDRRHSFLVASGKGDEAAQTAGTLPTNMLLNTSSRSPDMTTRPCRVNIYSQDKSKFKCWTTDLPLTFRVKNGCDHIARQ